MPEVVSRATCLQSELHMQGRMMTLFCHQVLKISTGQPSPSGTGYKAYMVPGESRITQQGAIDPSVLSAMHAMLTITNCRHGHSPYRQMVHIASELRLSATQYAPAKHLARDSKKDASQVRSPGISSDSDARLYSEVGMGG